jgi:hypothetical protein
MEMLSFGTLELRKVANKVLIDGPREQLWVLKKHLELCGLHPNERRDPSTDAARLEVQPGPDAKRVQDLVDEWTL